VCLAGVLSLSDARDRFGAAVGGYFAHWIEVLGVRCGAAIMTKMRAVVRAEQIVGGIQGATVLARAMHDPAVFERIVAQLRRDGK